ncbi:response regulator [Pseudoduganella danionis]|uniref:histidine kinase n=1 Tax=Pseudoduganella danionis TaxID=1890295 RepID=A0ABW9SJI4_9BURK|nr:response regulator [Pseudoduganella danionis]MTW32312.1 response regulator [Pseudoduganella danionis]
MKLHTLQKFRKLFGILVAAVALVLVVVAVFVAHVLQESRERYYANAGATAHNLAISLENFLQSHFEEVDLAMRRADVEFRNMQLEHRYSDEKFSAYLRTLRERIPNAQAVRGSNAAGKVIFGEQIDLSRPQDLTIREFFQRAKAEHELIISIPVKSRISGEWVLPMAYPLTAADGSFGGTVYALMNSDRLTELFSSLNVGPNGSILLLDDRRRVLHRYPFVDDMQFGATIPVAPQTRAILEGKQRGTTYNVVSPHDGRERALSIERVGSYPIAILVGLASEDFLQPWHREVRNALLFLGVVAGIVVLLLLASVWYSMQRHYQSLSRLVDTDLALQGSLTQLQASEARWRSLAEGLPQMVWTVTPELRVDFMSQHWERFSAVPSAQLIEAGSWAPVLHPDDRAVLLAEWQRAAAAGDEFRCDCRLRRHDGAWRIFDNHALPRKNAAGVILGWVGSSTDCTEARAAHVALLQAKEEAVQAGRAKSDFVANMSHEIRSPMNAVLGMLQLLQQTEMSERQCDYVAKAHAAASALLGLLNDVLDFSKVEAGKLELDPHPFRLDKLWRDLAVILSANVGNKDIEVLFRIDPALPQMVVADALRLQQILLNLAGNAIKFTAHGEVVLSATLKESSAQGLSIGFSIRDSGIGISAEQCQYIFDGFAQAEASTARRYGGTGLGLAISQRLVQLMGGSLRVESTLGQGSVFEFELPVQKVQQEPAVPAELAPASLPLQDMQCLVVDDNEVARTVLSEMARSFGWQVEVAASGQQALAAIEARLAQQRSYDVVFIDWRMPGLDGWETSCAIRQMATPGKMPLIVMVTAHDRELLAQRHQNLAPVLDGFVVKPVTASMLFDAVADARLGRRPPLAAVAVPAMHRLQGLRLLLVDDNPANQQVASELLSNDGAHVVVASSGPMAIAAVTDGSPLPDLILMDIQMPEMDGYQATRAIQAWLGAAAPPIVAMTANAMAADRQAALAAGMVDHVGKPFDLSQLISVILNHTRPQSMVLASLLAGDTAASSLAAQPVAGEAAGYGGTIAPDHALAPAPGIRYEAAIKRLGGMQSVYVATLRGFISEGPRLAALLGAATQAADMAAAMPALHTLKGLAGTVGAERLQALAQTAELLLHEEASTPFWAQLARVLEATTPVLAEVEELLARLESTV